MSWSNSVFLGKVGCWLTQDRYFCNPNTEALIEVIPGTYEEEAQKKYSGVKSGDYLVQRLKATY